MNESTKFFALLSHAKHHLSLMEGRVVHSQESFNAYTAEVIEMMNYLADFGFFCSMEFLQEFMMIMLPCTPCPPNSLFIGQKRTGEIGQTDRKSGGEATGWSPILMPRSKFSLLSLHDFLCSTVALPPGKYIIRKIKD